MVLGMWKSTAGSHTCTQEFVVGIVHLVTTEDGLQAALVKGFVVGYQSQALNQRLYLRPDFREDRRLLCIATSKTMHLTAPIVVIVRLGLYQGVEPVNNLTIPDDDYAHGADAGPLVIGRLEVYSSKISHRMSSLYLSHMCSEISASSSRNHLGDNTSISLPIVRIS